jgi:hypothetical protein
MDENRSRICFRGAASRLGMSRVSRPSAADRVDVEDMDTSCCGVDDAMDVSTVCGEPPAPFTGVGV